MHWTLTTHSYRLELLIQRTKMNIYIYIYMHTYIYTYIHIHIYILIIALNCWIWLGHVGNISIRPLGCGYFYLYVEPPEPQVKEKPGKEDRKASKAGVAPCSRFGDGTLGQKGTMASWLLFFLEVIAT